MPKPAQKTAVLKTREALIAYIKTEYPDYDFDKPMDDPDNRRILEEIGTRIFPSPKSIRKREGITKRTASGSAHELVEMVVRGGYPHGMTGWKDLPLSAKGTTNNHKITRYMLRYHRRHEKMPVNETLRAALKLHLAAKTEFSDDFLNVQISTFIKHGETHIRFQEAVNEITKKISGKREGRENYLRAILTPDSRIGNTPMPFSRSHLWEYTAQRHSALIRHIRPNLPRRFSDAHQQYKQSL